MSVACATPIPAFKLYDPNKKIINQLVPKGPIQQCHEKDNKFSHAKFFIEYIPLIILQGRVQIYAVYPSTIEEITK